MDDPADDLACPCYGCAIERQRGGVPTTTSDRDEESCEPSGACATHGRCWTHSEWVDEARCDPPGACVEKLGCATHGEART